MRYPCPGSRPLQWQQDTATSTLSIIKGLNESTATIVAFSGNADILALYCSVDGQVDCQGICPNADVTGIGVRVAFYLNALFTALLVGLSPEDSPGAAWSSAILTLSLVIPAIIQKKQEALTLYHATQVLNFVTFSSLASLAVAPLCSVWRVIDNKDHPQHITRLQSPYQIPLANLSPRYRSSPSPPPSPTETTHSTVPERRRSRVILSFALIAQVSLQWAWAAYLFASPDYAQQACNPVTYIVLFGKTLTAEVINDHHFWLWAGWLLFSILITLIFSILLVISSTSGANANKEPKEPLRPPKVSWFAATMKKWDPRGDKRRVAIITIAFVICTLIIAFSEMQAVANCVSDENTQWGFGQIAAFLFALVPLWSIVQSRRLRLFIRGASAKFSKRESGRQAQDPARDVYYGHSVDTSTEPLLFGEEQSSTTSPSPSSQHSELPMTSSTSPLLIPRNPTIQLIPPTRPHSRATIL